MTPDERERLMKIRDGNNAETTEETLRFLAELLLDFDLALDKLDWYARRSLRADRRS